MARNTSLYGEARCEVPACKIQCGTNDEIWDLRHGLRPNESQPVVGFGLQEVTGVS